MPQPSSVWRPRQSIRVIAVAVIRRRHELLLMAVRRDDSAIKGWRPLGGEVEFGETATAALMREIVEETGESITISRQLATLENIYTHEGATGHEIVLVFEAEFRNAAMYQKEAFAFVDGGVSNDVAWVDHAKFLAGDEALFPDGLLETLCR